MSGDADKDKPARDARATSLDAGQFTRLVAIVALLLSLAASVISAWLLYAIYSSIGHLKADKALPKFDSHYDAIAAAASVGRLDVLSMVLGLFAVVAAVGVIYSYTMFRSAAVEAAIRETGAGLPAALRAHLAEHGDDLMRAALRDYELLAHIQAQFTSIGLSDTGTAEAVDTDADWKGDGDA